VSRRAFVVVLDACGAGALPDAADYGDAGANTLGHLAEALGGLDLPVLGRLGLGNVLPLRGVPPVDDPSLHGRLHPLGPGKDSTTGHWELMGVVAPQAPPTYPEGFPDDLVSALEAATGHGFLCNRPTNGVTVLDEYGEEHLRDGLLILYTSQDSVLQIAAHHDVLGERELHDVCVTVRETLRPPHLVGRVIARPFTGAPGHFERTPGRRDLSVPPPARSHLDALQDAGVPVRAVGKVGDLFAGVGIDETLPGATNAAALAQTTKCIEEGDGPSLVFANLIETDQVYGHRKDLEGFHGALREIDATVGAWLGMLRPDDLLVLTADHGVDMTTPGTDHTREHAFLLAVAGGLGGRRHDGPLADVGASVVAWLTGRATDGVPGRPFLEAHDGG
jgi:phosphopentomutase